MSLGEEKYLPSFADTLIWDLIASMTPTFINLALLNRSPPFWMLNFKLIFCANYFQTALKSHLDQFHKNLAFFMEIALSNYALPPEIVEKTFVVSRFSDIRKETTLFLVVPKRKDQERRSYSVVSARNNQKRHN